MPSNKVTYTFIAIDEFSRVCNKLQKCVKGLTRTITTHSAPAQKKFNKTLLETGMAQNVFAKASKKTAFAAAEANEKVEEVTSNFEKFKNKIIKTSGHLQQFGTHMSAVSDMFGMGAYYRFMNIAMPMAVIAKLGMDYSDSLESANLQIKLLFRHTKGLAGYQQQISAAAKKYSALSVGFSPADITASIAIAARETGNIKAGIKAIPFLMQYAIGTNQTKSLAQATEKAMGEIRSGRATDVMGMRLTGATGTLRTGQWERGVSYAFKGAIPAYAKTSGAQIAGFAIAFKKLAGAIMMSIAPAFEMYNRLLTPLVPKIQKFIAVHTTLFKVLGEVAVASIVFLGVLMALGAASGVIAMPFVFYNSVIKLGTGLIKAYRIACVATWWVIKLLRIDIAVFRLSLIAWGISLKAVTAATWLWNAALDANPIVLILAGIALLIISGYELIKHWKTIKKVFHEALDWVGDKIKSIRADLKGLIHDLSTLSWHGLMQYGEGMATSGAKSVLAYGKTDISAGKAAIGSHESLYHRFEHFVHVNVDVHDKSGTVSAVHSASSPHTTTHTNLGTNMAHT